MSGPGDESDDGFLRRWSRLKRAEKPASIEVAEEQAIAPAADDQPSGPEPAELDEAALADLPDIDSLDKDSDYTVFMRDGVPEALRQRALRKLWLSDPTLANLDGLNDYDDDFGAIFRDGAAFMKRLADEGERLTRPGAEDDAPKEPAGEEEATTERLAEAERAEDAADPALPGSGKAGDSA